MIYPVLEEVYKAVLPSKQRTAAKGGNESHDQIEPMICTCEKEQPGMPRLQGCGAYWKLRLTYEPR